MAVLNKIRQRSAFLIIIIALALFSFVLDGVIRNGGLTSQKSQNTVATINDVDIKQQDFAKKVNDASRSFGSNGSALRAVNYVYDQEVRSVVLGEQLEELGIQVGNDQLQQLLEKNLANNPTFQNEDGAYDQSKVRAYLNDINTAGNTEAISRWSDYQTSLAQAAQEQAYFNMIKAASGATLKEGELAYKMENDNLSLKYVQVPYTSIADSLITLSDNEINTYVKAHASEYQSEASRDLQYVLFKEEASTEDEENIKIEVAKLLPELKEATPASEFVNLNSAIKYADRFLYKKELPEAIADTLMTAAIGDTYGPYKDGDYIKIAKVEAKKQLPDSVKASHILISWKGLQTETDSTRTKEQAKIMADSLLAVVKRRKSKFKELAALFSADNSNKDKAGDLGYFTAGKMVPEFNDYVFQNKTGDMSVVATQFGYHVIAIEDQKNKQETVKLAVVAQKIEPSEETINTVFKNTTKFEMASSKGDYPTVAQTEKYEVKPVNKIKAMDEFIPGLQSQRAMVKWAFNEETAIGDVKRFQVKDGYAVAQLTAKAEKGLMDAKEAKSKVEPMLLKDKKAAMIKAKLSGTTLNELAKSQNVTVKNTASLTLKNPTISGAGNEPKVVGAAFGLEKGKVSTPIQGEKGVYIVEVTGKTEAKALDSYKGFSNTAGKATAGKVNTEVYNALKEKAEIEDNRVKFY